jgi:mono/diheme cytochrome c family protein
MPSFKLLSEVEIDALVEYVKYLSIRGEVERMLVEEMAIELDEGELLVDPDDPQGSMEFIVEDFLATVVAKWQRAESEVTPVPARPEMDDEEMLASVERGRDLFYGAIANCVKCHGLAQLGDGQQDDYDEWAKDFHDLTSVASADERQKIVDELVSLGGLPPRNIIPRNLRLGVYRGGRRPVDIYWRILNGIEGSPMPAAVLRPPGAPPESKGLSPDDLWDIVNYVQALPYELMSTTGGDVPVYSQLRR